MKPPDKKFDLVLSHRLNSGPYYELYVTLDFNMLDTDIMLEGCYVGGGVGGTLLATKIETEMGHHANKRVDIVCNPDTLSQIMDTFKEYKYVIGEATFEHGAWSFGLSGAAHW